MYRARPKTELLNAVFAGGRTAGRGRREQERAAGGAREATAKIGRLIVNIGSLGQTSKTPAGLCEPNF